MSSLEKISTLVNSQVPEFIRAEHPVFVEFIEKYYEFLEQIGYPVYELKRIQDDYDIDTARANLLQYFKNKFLPSFPDKTNLSTERIIKLAREFYAKKGTPEAFKFLFKVLYDVDLEIYFPKLQILKASDGKWVSPQAFRLSFTSASAGVDLNLIEGRKAYGSISRASCVIETANLTIDKATGREIIEVYVSNVNRFFQNGEQLEIEYIDENGQTQLFSEKIIGSISNIKINPNRRGTKYRTGDPVVISGGLDPYSETGVKAVATVGNVTTGSIDSVSVLKRGYAFRQYPNSLVDIVTANGVGANIIVSSLDTSNSITVNYSTDSILYKKDLVINAIDYDFDNAIATYSNLTIGAGNTTTAVNLATTTFLDSFLGIAGNTVTDFYKSMVLTIVEGTGSGSLPNSATIYGYDATTKIATLSSALAVAPDGTSKVLLTSNANTTLLKTFSYEPYILSPIYQVTVVNGGSFFSDVPEVNVISLYDSDYSGAEGFITLNPGDFNSYSTTTNTINLGMSSSSTNGFYIGWRIMLEKQFRTIINYDGTTRIAQLDRGFEVNINETNILTKNLSLDSRPSIQGMGHIAKVEVLGGGIGYSATNNVAFVGTGCNANAYITVNGITGAITEVIIDNYGEGYPVPPTVVVTSATGSNAVLQAVLFSDGETLDVVTSKIGQIKDFNIINRGSDYISTPNVSLKIFDLYIEPILETQSIIENDIVYQGVDINSPSFYAIVDSYDPATSIVRVYNYSGVPSPTDMNVYRATTSTEFTTIVQPATIGGKTYPYFYGDGKAKAEAEFLNGLIKYNGFYLNTDGQLSSDKKLEDDEKYHNYSYSLVSEISSSEYEKTILDAVHPVGTKIIPIHVIKDDHLIGERTNINAHTEILTTDTLISNCNVDYDSTVVTGEVEFFDFLANTGDFIIINSSNTNRQFVKVITDIASNNSLNIESSCILVGEGRANTNAFNAIIQIHGHSNALPAFIDTGDKIRINVSGNSITRTINSISGNSITLNTNAGIYSTSSNIVYEVLPRFNVVDYKIIRTLQ